MNINQFEYLLLFQTLILTKIHHQMMIVATVMRTVRADSKTAHGQRMNQSKTRNYERKPLKMQKRKSEKINCPNI